MGLSRQEINLRRLLAKCELMCKSKQKDDERMPKYVETLEDMYQELKKISDGDFLMSYQKRIGAIRAELGIIGSKYATENDSEKMREELLGLRHRGLHQVEDANDLDEIIDYHENMQEKITSEMLMLTKSLKEQSHIATKIIKRDTEVLTKSSQLTDKNYAKLSTESNKLSDYSKRACKCWLWIMLAIVVIVFINMVLFMKVMKKK